MLTVKPGFEGHRASGGIVMAWGKRISTTLSHSLCRIPTINLTPTSNNSCFAINQTRYHFPFDDKVKRSSTNQVREKDEVKTNRAKFAGKVEHDLRNSSLGHHSHGGEEFSGVGRLEKEGVRREITLSVEGSSITGSY